LSAAVLLAFAACTNGTSGPASTASNQTGSPRTFGPTAPAPASSVVWPAPADPMELTVAAGLVPETVEKLAFHVHAHLDVFVDGKPVIVPAGIGIDTTSPGVKSFSEADGSTSWGGIEGCPEPCISPLHTHAQFGILHTESATPVPNRLGQFFTEWDVALTATCVGDYCSPETPIAFYVNGQPHTGDPAAIELADGKEIAIVIGTPPAQIPSTADFSLP
jgi:hypothetical protein